MSFMEPEIPEKVPVPGGGTGVNQPDSPYGDVKKLSDLRREFPGNPVPGTLGAPSPMGQGIPSPVPPPGTPMGPGKESPVPGIPAPMFDPTDRPDVDPGRVSEIPERPPMGNRADNRHLQVLMGMTQSPDEETREWAEMVLEAMGVRGG